MSADKFEHITHRKKTIFINNFVGGIAWGLGATVGLAVVLTILTVVVRWIDVVPVVGDFVARVTEFVEKSRDFK